MTHPDTQHPLADLLAAPDPRDPRATGVLRAPGDASARGWALLGLPYDGGIPSRPGARFGPAALRRALASFGAYDGVETVRPLEDLGNIALPAMNGGAAHARIEGAAARLFAGDRPIAFVGGDHGCTGSLIRGLGRARPEARLAVISIDAHLDVREYDDASSLSSGTPFRRALETPILTGTRMAVIGLQPFANSAFYLDWARDRGIHFFGVDAVADRGPVALAKEALDAAASGADCIYLSVDLDAADAAYAPGVSAPSVGGLTAREMIALVGAVASDPRLLAVDLMELSPPYDHDGRTAKLAARLLLQALRFRPG